MSSGKMHEDEFDTDAALVRRLIAAQFPQWADLPIEQLHSAGTVNTIYRLGTDKSVRLPRRPDADDGLDQDLRWLPPLAPLLPVPVPVPLAVGEPTVAYPSRWSVYNWLPGETVLPGELTEPYLLAADLAAFVTAFRRIDLPDAPPAYRGGPLATEDAATRTAIGKLTGTIDTGTAAAAWDATLAVPEWTGPPVWQHADLMPGNVLTAGGRLSAVIDFGCTGVGDPACDLIIAWQLLPAAAREEFRTAVRVDDATWLRGRGRALSQGLIALPYYQHTNPEMAAIGRYAIGEVLADFQRYG